MSSREALAKELVELRTALKLPPVNPDSLRPDQLEKAVTNLRKKAVDEGLLEQPAASTAPETTTSETDQPQVMAALGALAREEPTTTEASPPVEGGERYVVGPRKGVTSLRGILTDGTIVTGDDFEGGAQSLRELVAAGLIVKR